MYSDEKITLTLELDQNIAWALAQFCKRTLKQNYQTGIYAITLD